MFRQDSAIKGGLVYRAAKGVVVDHGGGGCCAGGGNKRSELVMYVSDMVKRMAILCCDW